MKDLQAIRGTTILRRMVAEGEHERQDFKFAISDARKIARSLSAFANHSGGRLLIGVKDNGVIAGVRNEEDIYVVEQAAERYCRPPQRITFKAYRLEGSVRVIVAEIAASDVRPVSVDEGAGLLKAYYRVADENIAATPMMMCAWQLASDPEAAPLDSRHYSLAAIFDSLDVRLDEQQISLRLHLSVADTCEMIARLAAAGVLRFVHDSAGRFLVAAAEA